jgi:hypothetical protein
MFPVAPFVVYLGFLEFAILGLIIGAVSGILVSIIFKLPVKKIAILMNAFLGAFGFLMMWFVVFAMNLHHDPFIPSVIFAGVLPALYQFFRFRRLGHVIK